MLDGQPKDAVFIEVPWAPPSGILPSTIPAILHFVVAKKIHEGGRSDGKERCDCPQREEEEEEG